MLTLTWIESYIETSKKYKR